jgi:hypothetical protein
MSLNGHQGVKPKPFRFVPDYTGGLCILHDDKDLWDSDTSIARDMARQASAKWANGRAAEAKGICNGGIGALPCPVREVCLRAALEDEKGMSGFYRSGVRGGLDRYERAEVGRRVPS